MRPFLVAVCLISGLIFAGGCKKAASNDIVVGEYGSTSGKNATFGLSTDYGIKLAIKQKNAAGGINGKQVSLKMYDDAGKSTEAASDVTRLIQEDHAVAVLGEVASSLSLAGGQVAQQMGVPMISPSSTNERVTKLGDMVSRVCYIDSYQGKVCADFAVGNLKLTNAAILFNKSQAYSQGLCENFKTAFEQAGGKIVATESFSDGDTDYSAQLTTIRNAHPQIIFMPIYYNEIVSISVQARKLDITVPLLGADGWVSDTLKEAHGALDGCYFSDHYAKEDTSPEVTSFLTAYRAEYHSEPDSMAALGYDAANLLFDAMGRAKSMSGPDLAAAINSTKGFKGVTGLITIDPNRNASKGCVIEVLDKDGNYKLFAKIAAPK